MGGARATKELVDLVCIRNEQKFWGVELREKRTAQNNMVEDWSPSLRNGQDF